MNDPGLDKADTATLPWFRWGLGFAILFSGLTLTRLLMRKTQVGVAEAMNQTPRPTFDLMEILRISVIAFLMGFVCGLVAWAARKSTRHLGAFGDVVVGVLVVCSLLLMCITTFDPEVFSRGWFILLRLFGLASAFGAILGFLMGREARREAAIDRN